MAHRTERIEFRASAEQKARWLEAAKALGHHETSDFYRAALDSLADTVIERRLPPAPAALAASGRQAKPDPRRGRK